jgi:bifunctional non-homologous end joining protein LigD
VIDGEIVCVDGDGKPRFYDLLYRRGTPILIAFDILSRGEEDVRHLPLIDGKLELRRVLRQCSSPCAVYADHIEGNGVALFERVCELDIEGVVAKHRWGPYTSDAEASTWFKIRNRRYSQWIGQDEAFERDRHREPIAG